MWVWAGTWSAEEFPGPPDDQPGDTLRVVKPVIFKRFPKSNETHNEKKMTSSMFKQLRFASSHSLWASWSGVLLGWENKSCVMGRPQGAAPTPGEQPTSTLTWLDCSSRGRKKPLLGGRAGCRQCRCGDCAACSRCQMAGGVSAASPTLRARGVLSPRDNTVASLLWACAVGLGCVSSVHWPSI